MDALTERYEELIRNRDMTVLLAGDGPDGFAQLRYRPWVYSAGPYAHSYLEELYVVPVLRGQGIGRALLEAAMDAARGEGATTWSSERARPTSGPRALRGAPDSRIAKENRTDR